MPDYTSSRRSILKAAGGAAGLGGLAGHVGADAGRSDDDSECTLVIGYSQTADWYMAPVHRNDDPDQPQAASIFEGQVDGDRWQLLWEPGAGVNNWKNPDFEGWENEILYPCESNCEEPDRIVYMISGPHGEDEEEWRSDIREAIDTIRDKYPSAETIALESIVGPPEGVEECYYEDEEEPIRASWQYFHIANAIEDVAADTEDVVVGALARVKSCAHYTDWLGHIDGGGGASVAASIGQFYRDFDWE